MGIFTKIESMSKQEKYTIIKNEQYGYYEIANKPNSSTLNEYYAQKYYQDSEEKVNKYKSKYAQADLNYIKQKVAQKYNFAHQNYAFNHFKTAIDIGCGEGHAISFLVDKGISTLGVDYSDFGYKTHHPEIAKYCTKGNTLEVLDELITQKQRFDLIWLDNVLEHVIDPVQLLEKCYAIAAEKGLIVIEVPNDYSTFQHYLKEQKLISRDYWFAPPDHLNYFSPSSLTALCQSQNWQLKQQMADFPIELFLLNDNSNYSENRSVGKGAHLARMRFNDYLAQTLNLNQINQLYTSLLDAGIGRQIIGLYEKV